MGCFQMGELFSTASLHRKAMRDVAVQRRFAPCPPPEKPQKCFAKQAPLCILCISLVVLNNYQMGLYGYDAENDTECEHQKADQIVG